MATSIGDLLRSQLYASDASVYQILPLGIVRPRHAADVRHCIAYAADNAIPVFARGAGTGLAGQSLGPGIVLDFSRICVAFCMWTRANKTVCVQPGVVLAELNRVLATHDCLFGPDPRLDR